MTIEQQSNRPLRRALCPPGAFTGLTFYAALLLILGAIALYNGGGQFTYSLDDPYIHMAVAKHFVQDGVWGVTKYQPSSSVSSVIWPILIAGAYWVFGVSDLVPFILNILIGAALVMYIAHALARYRVPPTRARLLTPLFVAIGYVTANVFGGMEHTLQCLVDLVFVVEAVEFLAQNPKPHSAIWRLLVLAPIVTATRYEGVFIAAIVCGLLLLRRRILLAVLVGAAAWLPLTIYGLIMMRHGFAFFPYSVLVKANPASPPLGGPHALFGSRLVAQTLMTPEMFALALALAVNLYGFRKRRLPFWSNSVLLHVITLIAIFFHLEFASVLSLFRYHAYLLILALFALAVSTGPVFDLGLKPPRGRRMWAWAVLALPVLRAALVIGTTPLATANIHQQQFQMAKFLRAYYPNATVALNDIGAVGFFTNVHIVDCVGLATPEVARARLNHRWSFNAMNRIVTQKKTAIAVIYRAWFDHLPGFPGHWTPVGSWQIPWNVTCGSPEVNFYAISPGQTARLTNSLREFARQLPPQVYQGGPYTRRSNS